MNPAAVSDLVEASHTFLTDAFHHLHRNAELSGEERLTAAYVAEQLRARGLSAQERVGGGYGIVADLVGGRPGPTLAFVAHMDALPLQEPADHPFASINPGVMHACGHDANVAVVLATAAALAGFAAEVPGRVRFIFEPSEEVPPGGAQDLIAAGCLDGVDAVFGLHQAPSPAGRLHLTPGPIMASGDNFRITVSGRSGHGAEPETGVDAVLVAAHLITAIHAIVGRRVSPRAAAVINIGTIRGGRKDNVVPDSAELTGTLRTLDPDVRHVLHEQLRKMAAGTTAAWGATADLELSLGYPVLVNEPRMTDIAIGAAQAALGPDGVVHGGWPLALAMDDFARYLERVPGCYAGLGVGNRDDPARRRVHTDLYRLDPAGLPAGVAWLLTLALTFDDLRQAQEAAGR